MRSKERRRPRLPWIKNRRRAINAAQNALIILLVISSVLLAGGRAGFSLRENISGYGAFSRSDGAQQGPQYGAAAEPMSIVVTPEDGIHDAAMYDSRALDEAYSRYSAALAEALGSAGEPEEVGESEWVSALHGPGVYFDYYTDCQLSSLAIWLGSEMNGGAAGHTARRLCLSLEGEEVTLYYYRVRGVSAAYRCSTGLSVTELTERIMESEPDGSRFVFELDEPLEKVDPYAVLVSGDIEVRTLAGENSLDAADSDALMSAFGLNSDLVSSYTEADGTGVYLEGTTTLRLGANGTVRFTRPGATVTSAISPADAVQRAREVLEQTVGLVSGVAELRLSYIFFDSASGEYTLRFDYAVDGLPVSLAGRECAAEIRLAGPAVAYADIAFRSYSYTGGSERPLPARIAAALAEAGEGGEPRLEYMDGYGSVSADWVVI